VAVNINKWKLGEEGRKYSGEECLHLCSNKDIFACEYQNPYGQGQCWGYGEKGASEIADTSEASEKAANRWVPPVDQGFFCAVKIPDLSPGESAATSTTTQPPLPLPAANCESPADAKVCHFWGDPHFTHLFNDKLDEREVQKGGRMHGGAVLNFNPSGVFELANGEDFKVQAFFCPAYADTTTGVGLAMQFGEDIIQIIRGEETQPTKNVDSHDFGYFANFLGDENKYTEFFLNGQKKEWSDLGDAVSTRGENVPGTGGLTSVSAFLRQMKTEHESSISMLPICAGDDKHNLVEVSTPWFDSTTGQRVYEHAVTIRSSASNLGGICAASAETISSDSESFRVKPEDNLFTLKQMNSLCGQCRLHMDHGACGAPSKEVSAKDVCQATNADYDSAADACKGQGFAEGTSWFDACVVETCVTGEQALPIAKMEQHLASVDFGR
jgi:hypothetical protein